jgi:hypothetical protein
VVQKYLWAAVVEQGMLTTVLSHLTMAAMEVASFLSGQII